MFDHTAVEKLLDTLTPSLLMPYTRKAVIASDNPLFNVNIDHTFFIADIRIYCYSETIDFDMIVIATGEQYTQGLIVENFEDLARLYQNFLQRINATFCSLLAQT